MCQRIVNPLQLLKGMKTALLVSAFALTWGSPASSQSGIVPARMYQTGNTLLALCEDPVSNGICIGYIQGVIDGMEGMGIGGDLPKLTIPLNVTGNQLRAVVTKYLKANPEERHYNAGQLVYLSLRSAFHD